MSNLYKTGLRLNRDIPEQAEAIERIQNRPKELSISQFVAKAIIAYGKNTDYETESIGNDNIYSIVKEAMKECLSEYKITEKPEKGVDTKDSVLDSDMLQDLGKIL